MKLSQKNAQFHALLRIVLLIILDFQWHCFIVSLITFAATGKIYDK